jgi:hypothetical protein
LDKPFLGNLVLRLPLVAADSWCKTSATDAKSFYYNPEFIDSLLKKKRRPDYPHLPYFQAQVLVVIGLHAYRRLIA